MRGSSYGATVYVAEKHDGDRRSAASYCAFRRITSSIASIDRPRSLEETKIKVPGKSGLRAHSHVEDNIGRLNDSAASRFAFCDFDANSAWLATVCMADALVRWFQQLCLTGPLAAAEPKTLRWSLWHTPARIVRRSRRRIVRILDRWPSAAVLLDAYGRIELIT